ncbi:sulfotransferase [Glutamicibacter sp. BW80]|uniref:sulfotransferase family protein n=1 Tax=Glutamicibacter sp. BW80 TaxID=2024404 RepID=UPI000BB68766|nr:sulfotransferase [Glutamicibacter sp. BW80]PCC27458.1 sulfotransferase [Glutamicibacter sp. BW80]
MIGNRIRALTKQAKKVLPAPVIGALRAGMQGIGMLSAPARTLPDFIIIGAQRSGTTSLYRLLSAHPAVARPTASKGIGYFDVDYARGMRWYRGHFPLRLTAAILPGSSVRQVFESSGYYCFHPLAAERISTDLPDVKLVMMLRDPVERAYSAHRHELVRGFETEDFETALELEDQRLAGEDQRLIDDPQYQSHNHRHHAYLRRGLYAQQIRRIHEAVGSDRLYLMDADDFFQHPIEEFRTLLKWLGLPDSIPDSVPAENAQPRAEMDEQLRARLRDYFAAPDSELAELMGKTPSWRR